MNAAFLALSTATIGGAVAGVVMAVGEARYVAAQHAARTTWERTGRAVAGWSEHFAWSHDKTTDAEVIGRGVVNVFTTITNVVNVTHVHIRSLPLAAGLGGGGGTQAPTARVIPGRTVPAALPAGSRATDALGAMTRTVTSGGAR